MERKQPTVVGVSETGELVWSFLPMELWQILMCYRKQYVGDFCEQWMRLSSHVKYGWDWDKYDQEGN